MQSYPEFISWCRSVEILTQTPCLIKAKTDIELSFFKGSFNSHVTLKPYKSVQIVHQEQGVLKHLESVWSFKESAPGVCEVGFFIDVQLAHFLYNAVLAASISRIGEEMVGSFKTRLKNLYGGK